MYNFRGTETKTQMVCVPGAALSSQLKGCHGASRWSWVYSSALGRVEMLQAEVRGRCCGKLRHGLEPALLEVSKEDLRYPEGICRPLRTSEK